MRGVFRFPPLTPFVKKLLIGLLGAFVVTLVLEVWVGVPVTALLALDATKPGIWTAWQLFTYVLVWPAGPGSVFPVLIGLVFMWWILAPFEQRFGSKRVAQLCVVTTITASIPAFVVGLLFSAPPLYGFGPIIIGGIAAFAWTLPKDGSLSLFGVFPMKPIHLIGLVIGISLIMFLASMNVMDLVADLGSVGGGILFVKWMARPPVKRDKPKRNGGRRRPPAGWQVIDGGEDDDDDDERPRWLN